MRHAPDSRSLPPKLMLAATLSILGLGLGPIGCSDSSSSGAGQAFNPATDQALYVSQNGAGNAGTVTVTTQANGAANKTFMTGGNEGIVFDEDSNLWQANDQGGAPAFSLVGFLNPSMRADQASFQNNMDCEIFPSFGGNPKGVVYVSSRSVFLVAVFNGRTSAGTIVGVSASARGTAAAPINTVFSTAPFSGGNIAGINGVTATSPWDLSYDPSNDRLFVAVTDGSIAVYDNFFGAGLPNGRNASRFITPLINGANATNNHGIAFQNGVLAVSDVGPVTAGANDDGVIYVVPNANSASGNVNVNNVTGAPLGNPVDITLAQFQIFGAEKTNDLLFTAGDPFNFASSTGGVAGSANTKPESLAFFPGLNNAFDANDIESPGAVDQVLVVSNPGGNGGGTENQIMSFSSALVSNTSTFTVNLNLAVPGGVPPTRLRSLENIAVDKRGQVICVFGNDDTTLGGTVLGEGGLAFLARAFDSNRLSSPNSFDTSMDHAQLTGANTFLLDPKGVEVTNDTRRGSYVMVAENDSGNAAIVVFGANATGDVAPVGRTTDLGSAGRRPWDLDYDPDNDRLFVACTDGTLIVYDNYLQMVQAGGTLPGPNRSITPTYDNGGGVINAINLHGVVYDRRSDRIIVSDVGSAASPTDGAVLVFGSAASQDGSVPATTTITGNNTNLGNPVDLAFDGTNLFIAEKSNSVVLRYDNILSLSGDLNMAADSSVNVTNPESVTLLTGVQPR